jgi:hypothetical protein
MREENWITQTELLGLAVQISSSRITQNMVSESETRARNSRVWVSNTRTTLIRSGMRGQQQPDNPNQVTWVTSGRNLEEAKGASPSKRPAPWWCPRGITKTQRHMMQKMHQTELAEKTEEEQRDLWFHWIRPMTKVKQTWHEK